MTSRTAAFRRLLLAALAAAVATAALTSVAAATPSASAALACKPPAYPGSGYFTSLKTTNLSCKTGRKVVLAHYRCRVKHGKAGRCVSRVLGYACNEVRTSIPTEIDARVTCVNKSHKVVYSYQQNL